jgi:chromosome segregation ATPase
MTKQDKQLSEELQQQIDELREQYHTENELAQNEIERLRTQLEEMICNEQAYMALKTSYTEIEKRCVKHQKSEIEVKRQLSVYKGFVNDLQSEIQDLTQRLSDGADEYKTLFRKFTALEQQLNDLRLTSEKHQLSMEGQLNAYLKKIAEQVDQIKALEEEINLIDLLREKHSIETKEAKNELEALRSELNEKNVDQQAYMALKTSFIEIEKRCVKHQKTEIEVKRQLAGYQSFINDLQREIQDLTERLSAGAEEYKVLFRKYTALERSIQQQEKVEPTVDGSFNEEELVSVLRNTYENQQEKQETQIPSARSSLAADIDEEVRQCPVCSWEFPKNLNLDGKREHIEQHFA